MFMSKRLIWSNIPIVYDDLKLYSQKLCNDRTHYDRILEWSTKMCVQCEVTYVHYIHRTISVANTHNVFFWMIYDG